MKTPHKHAELIKAWADGASIQENVYEGKWFDIGINGGAILWSWKSDYRIKPEPKPDVVLYGKISVKSGYGFVEPVGVSPKRLNTDTCMFIFDGETGALKDAQVLAKLV